MARREIATQPPTTPPAIAVVLVLEVVVEGATVVRLLAIAFVAEDVGEEGGEDGSVMAAEGAETAE